MDKTAYVNKSHFKTGFRFYNMLNLLNPNREKQGFETGSSNF